MLGFDFSVDYRAGSLNKVADALSRRDKEVGVCYGLSAPYVAWFNAVKSEIEEEAILTTLRQQILNGEAGTVSKRWPYFL